MRVLDRGASRRLAGSAAILCASLLLAACAQHPSPSALSELKAEVVRGYPDWTIDRTLTHHSPGWDGGTTTLLILKWAGSEDFRLRRYYWGDGPFTLAFDRFFQDGEDARLFITAFKARHPEPGLVVDAQATGSIDLGHRRVDVFYWTLSDLTADPLSDAKREVWTYSTSDYSWAYYGPGQ